MLRTYDGTITGPLWPPNPFCEAVADRSAGQSFQADLNFWKPDPSDKLITDTTIDHTVKSSPRNQFKTGCRTETRNGLLWDVCLTAKLEYAEVTKPGMERRGGQIERWVARLGDSGFIIQIRVHYMEPLYLYPQWYAERQAAVREVVDSVFFEELPPPTQEEIDAAPGKVATFEAGVEVARQRDLKREEQVRREQERLDEVCKRITFGAKPECQSRWIKGPAIFSGPKGAR